MLVAISSREFQYSLANLVWCNTHWSSITFEAFDAVSVFSGESRVV